MQNRILPTGKPLSINTKNLEFPDIGTVIELYDDNAIVILANGNLTYAYFTSVERDAMKKYEPKLAVGSLVHVAVQYDEAKKMVEMQDEKKPVPMSPILIQEVQPVYPEKGSIVEVGYEYVKVKLAKTGVVETVLFSVAETQLIQDSNIHFAVDQVVNVSVRKVAANGRAIDIKEIGSPEPETAFFISPKAGLLPDVVSQSVSNPRTVFSFLQSINSPVAIKKRESVILNPTRALILEQFASDSPKLTPTHALLPAINNMTENKQKQILRRKVIVSPGNFLTNNVSASASTVLSLSQNVAPRLLTPEVTRDVSPVVSADRKPALLAKSNVSAMFPTISTLGRSGSSMSSTLPVDNIIDYHNELDDVLRRVITILKLEATSRSDIMLMKNLSYITQSRMPVENKLQLIITEVKKHNLLRYNVSGFYAPSSNMTPVGLVDAFTKSVANITLEKRDEKHLSQLKLLLPAQSSVNVFPPPQKNKTLRRY